ncbi:c-type cytochrome [Silicimonas algicola]|uniref:Cytochrome c n=1 Tax=Silicimonas algicola TaxID=1826607 RepID=A0A316G1R4_9RHOB|nr:c-type cytochrome [Silicimonas algicola]AZQ65832.1 c-type cytochrome [Silicimonas algicola]PWK54789.1 cytochrome c [Silicimonas algicola]
MRALALVMALVAAPVFAADFRILEGHGGPVMSADVSADGTRALTASFDNSVGLWTLGNDEVRWLEGHAAAVKTAIFLPGGLAASGGDDFAILLWDVVTGTLRTRLEGHEGQVAALAVSPDGTRLASAGWDGAIGLWDIATGERTGWLMGHDGAVNDVVFSDDGASLWSASADGTVRLWDIATGAEKRLVVRHGFGVNTLTLGDAWLAYGAVDGGTRVIDATTGDDLADLTLDRRPILTMALSPDGSELSVGDGQGFVMTVDTTSWDLIGDYRAAANGPVWALSYTSDGKSLIAGGIDDTAYVFPAHNALDAPIMATETRAFLNDPAKMSNGERQFQRKCSICHSLADDDTRRAGPTLAGLFGRKAGSLPDYSYSETVQRLGFAWTEDTVDKLFDLGPDHFIPGSKMPMQRITRPEDRQDLIEFLKDNT